MNFQPVTTIKPEHTTIPLILSSPHSGRTYPSDFHFICPLPLLRQTEDAYVDLLIANATKNGATVIQAEFPRSYIDVNRAENDLDPALLNESWPNPLQPSERTLRGLGLVRRLCRSGIPMYAAPLQVSEVKYRILSCYRPYHSALQTALHAQKQSYGMVYLLDCHSMPSQSTDTNNMRRPDFVLGDRDGISCEPAFIQLVQNSLQNMGYSVALNHPYKGMEILHRYGRPSNQSHALQLEINRHLYMNETTLLKNEGFLRLKDNLSKLVCDIADYISSLMPDRLAAE